MKVTEATRELAILLLAISASRREDGVVMRSVMNGDYTLGEIAGDLGYEDGIEAWNAVDLAKRAWIHVREHPFYAGSFAKALDAEAEALLRDGWSP